MIVMEIQRNIHLNRLISGRHNGMIKVVTGLRRCGKSYLLFNLFAKYLRNEGVDDAHIIKVNLEVLAQLHNSYLESLSSTTNSNLLLRL